MLRRLHSRTVYDTVVIGLFIFSLYKVSDVLYMPFAIEIFIYSMLFILLLPFYRLQKYNLNLAFLTSRCVEVLMLQFVLNITFDYIFKLSDREASYIPLIIELVVGFLLSAIVFVCYFYAVNTFKSKK
jgi:hypothetical protein